MPLNVEAPAPRNVTCSICHKRFSRTDHLKRHHLRHSGVKPYSCIFCSDSFTRSDNLRDHYPTCSHRENRPIPEAARGGRRSHACDTCTTMKLGCDGAVQCGTCRQKGIECRYSRLQSKNPGVSQDDSLSRSGQEDSISPGSDRGSIKFLLNSGTASFMECFRFPPSSERGDVLRFRNRSNTQNTLDFFEGRAENGMVSDPFEDEMVDWSLFQDENLLKLLSSPFIAGEPQIQVEEAFPPMFMNPNFAQAGPVSGPFPSNEWEPASVQSAAIVQALLTTAAILNLNPQEQADISLRLSDLFTPSKMERFISIYFECWHPHCPIVHQPSFTSETAPVPLLISMVLMGVMYSQTEHDLNSAKIILDLAELFIYSLDDLTEDSEITEMLRLSLASTPGQPPAVGLPALRSLQAAYMMVCVQFWAGNIVARKRAVETRFAVVIKTARKLGLTKVRHDIEDSLDENLWLHKESQIRTINAMTLLDSGFTFFCNFPSRISVTELNFDLSCQESFFSSLHPFSLPAFQYTRNLTVYEAFKSLFCQEKPQPPESQARKINPLGLDHVDMFTLIHLLYLYTHTQISLFSSLITQCPDTSGTSTPTSPAQDTFFDSNITLIKTALARWRAIWISVRASIPDSTWANFGFFRNGYNYWLVAQLLINNKASADLMNKIEVNCDDTLKQLKALLRDGGTEA